MMASFGEVGGDLGAPVAITGGIAEALIATASVCSSPCLLDPLQLAQLDD
jgi:hypothetical protein